MSTNWINATNVYEVNLRQYTDEGTIRAFMAHLPRLKQMGVETLWFMPITPISEKKRKGSLGSYYACSDYTSVAAEFGSIADWKSLVSEAHKMGFKVILDWVANHTGWDHPWTVLHPGWYKHDAHTGDFKMASGMEDIIELDFDNTEMKRAMINAMKFWITETDIDGFRCDLAFWVRLEFWMEAKAELEKIKQLFWLGELDVLKQNLYMKVFDAAYTWQWMHAAEKYFKNEISFSELLYTLELYQQADGIKTWFTANHDENTWNGTEFEKYGKLAKGLMVFSCTWPGIPLIYSGQEIPNQKRLAFFEKDPLNWNNEIQLENFFQQLLNLRRQFKAFSVQGELEWIRHDQLLAYKRSEAGEAFLVLINCSNQDVSFPLAEDGNSWNTLMAFDIIANESTIELFPYGFTIMQKTNPID